MAVINLCMAVMDDHVATLKLKQAVIKSLARLLLSIAIEGGRWTCTNVTSLVFFAERHISFASSVKQS